ncbi:MAG TPA: STAS domain-containing protein [Spirochaetota bacterium]|nr:STAS domain-containing protein [Spirochaetota bacterium]HPH02477.1 STAS domain-containing protein [Spirochaetota bacterium]HPN82129.1 STAS domain-containing protein [Spirochaetota bacterium]
MQDKTADIQHEDIQGVRVIELCTRIDIHNVFAVEETLTQLIDEGHTKVIIDFSRIEYFGSNGIRLLMLAKRKLDHLGGRLVLSSMSSFVVKILKAIDLYELFTILPDRASALEELQTNR